MELEAFCAPLWKNDSEREAEQKSSSAADTRGEAVVKERIAKSKDAERFRKLYEDGDLSEHGDDRSKADFCLLSMLRFWSGGNKALSFEIFSRSALGRRGKWREREDYRERTWDNIGEGPVYGDKKAQPIFEPVAWFPASDLENSDPPPRKWLVPQMIPMDNATLLSGDGGTGKSLFALQLAHAVANGIKFLGLDTRKGNALFLTAEDDKEELHRRLYSIAGSKRLIDAFKQGANDGAQEHSVKILEFDDENEEWPTPEELMADFENLDAGKLILGSAAGMDAVLANGAPGCALEVTKRFKEIKEKVEELRPVLLVLDTAADLYGSNENDRAHVRQFIGHLRKLAIEHKVAILLLSHPSLSGMDSGRGTSGSTAWNNSVRSRLYLERDNKADPDARVLRSMKSNYGPIGTEIRLKWHEGVFIPANGVGNESVGDRQERANETFLSLLRQFTSQGRNISVNSGSNYAPKKLAEHGGSGGLSKEEFTAAMDRLLDAGKIRSEEFGYESKRRHRLVIVTADEF